MELKEDMNVITVYAPDQIELAFDQIPDGEWIHVYSHSDYPHPLITVDFNREGVPFVVTVMSSLAPKLLELYAQWLRDIKAAKQDKSDIRIDGDRQALIDSLSEYYHEQS